jgi:hypothetical protein
MFLTEIKNVGKPNVEIDVKYSERDRTVRYGLLAISALSYTENQGGEFVNLTTIGLGLVGPFLRLPSLYAFSICMDFVKN